MFLIAGARHWGYGDEGLVWLHEQGDICFRKAEALGIVMDHLAKLARMAGQGLPLPRKFGDDIEPHRLGLARTARQRFKGPGPNGIAVEARGRSAQAVVGQIEGRLVVAMGIVRPCNEHALRAGFRKTRAQPLDQPIGRRALDGQAGVFLWPEPKVGGGNSEERRGRHGFGPAQGGQPFPRVTAGVRVRARTVCQNIDEDGDTRPRGLLNQPAAPDRLVVGMRREDEQRPVSHQSIEVDRWRSPPSCVRVRRGRQGKILYDFFNEEGTAKPSAGCMRVTHAAPENIDALKCGHKLIEAASAVADLASSNAAMLDRDGAFPDAEVRELHRRGLLHAPFPSTMDGDDLGSSPSDPVLLANILSRIGQGSLPLGRLYEGHINAIKLVRLYGSRENLALLKAEADAGRLSGVWMAEDQHSLVLIDEVGGRRLRGRKLLASGAGHVRRPLVAAKTEAGSVLMLPCVIGADRVDQSGWTPTGMKASATGTVDFTGIPIDADEVVGRPGDYLRSPYFRGGAWRVMAVQLGGVFALLESYREQVVGAGRDGDGMQRARFAEAVAAAETARLWIGEASKLAENPATNPAKVDVYVDLMRGTFQRAALLVLDHAQRSLGLKAFMRPNPVDQVARDLATYLRQPALDASLDAAGAFCFHQPLTTEMA